MSPAVQDAWLQRRSDEALASLAARGKERAFAILVDRHRDALLRFASRNVGHDRAEDVLQQSLMDAWSALRAGTEVEHVRGWLFQIVRHDSWKVAAQRTPCELPESLATDERLDVRVEVNTRLRQVVRHVMRLPASERIALVETAVEGRNAAEVAGVLGVTEGAVRQMVYRARVRLRHAVTVFLPSPLVGWLARRNDNGQRATDATAAGGLSTGAVAGAVKLGAVALTVGVAAVGVHAELNHAVRRAHARTQTAIESANSAPARSLFTPTAVTALAGVHAPIQAARAHRRIQHSERRAFVGSASTIASASSPSPLTSALPASATAHAASSTPSAPGADNASEASGGSSSPLPAGEASPSEASVPSEAPPSPADSEPSPEAPSPAPGEVSSSGDPSGSEASSSESSTTSGDSSSSSSSESPSSGEVP